jgi:WD40 repeat protein/serine/threonine protein kinase
MEDDFQPKQGARADIRQDGDGPSKPAAQDDDRPLLEHGDMVDGYTVIRQVGRGGMGEVYLARDTELGRKVALKVLRRDALGDPGAVDRFLFEARATARFNHPHIVTIYGVGTLDEHPYVALEFLEGQSLRERLLSSPPTGREVLRIGLAVAEALEEAQQHQILHRDLKPDNVMIPRDGRIRVVDFGLALRVSPDDVPSLAAGDSKRISEAMGPSSRELFESTGTGVRGTPMYMSPEQWTERPATGASDVWALGLMLWELAAGTHPYAGSQLVQVCAQVIDSKPVPQLPESIDLRLRELIARCVDKRPDQRPPVAEVVTVLEELVHGPSTRTIRKLGPFRGLQACEERDAELFFGRDAEIDTFLERLRDEPALPVVGASGAGKSSFVQAGVIPRLREGGRWIVVALRPGRRPFRTLAARLAQGESARGSSGTVSSLDRSHATGSTMKELEAVEKELRDELRTCPGKLALRLGDLARSESRVGEPARVLLFVDQLEELVTLVADDDERRAFLAAVCSAADDAEGPVRVVFTLRDDFLGRLAEGPEARDVLGRVTVLRTPGRAALEEILTRSVAAADHEFDDPDLATAMAAEVDGEPAALPLLQVAGQLLWDRRDRNARRLRRADYEAMGGVAGALAHHADGVLDALSQEQLAMARALLQRLVTPERTRRVVPRSELLADLPTVAEDVLDRLVEGRLLQARRARRGSGEAEAELVHESLIRSWSRFARWLDDSRDESAFLAEVGQAAGLWELRGRPHNEVWRGDALRDAQRRADRVPHLPGEIGAFLRAGHDAEERGTRRRRWLVTGVIAALVAIAAVLGLAQREAVRQREVAKQQQARAEVEGARAAYARGDRVEARAKLRTALEIQDTAAARALWQQLRHDFIVDLEPACEGIYDALLFPDGGTAAVACWSGALVLVDTETGDTRFLRGEPDILSSLALSPDGTWLATASWDGGIGIWDVEQGQLTRWHAHDGHVTDVRFSVDGRFLASGGDDAAVRIWDAETHEPLATLRGHPAPVTAVCFDRDGGRVASGDQGGSVRIWDRASGTEQHRLAGHDDWVTAVRFASGGTTLAGSNYEGQLLLWDTATGELRHELEGHSGTINRVDVSPDGATLCSAGVDDTIRLWDVASGQPLRVLRGHQTDVVSARFGADGETLLSGETRGTLLRWNLATEDDATRRVGHAAPVIDASFHPDGERLATTDHDGRLLEWDTRRGTILQEFEDSSDIAGFYHVDHSEDGRLLGTIDGEGMIRVWDLDADALVRQFKAHGDGGTALEFGSGPLLATADNHRVRLWDVDRDKPAGALPEHEGLVSDLTFRPDGRVLATASIDRIIRLWRLPAGELLQILEGHPGRISALAFRDDGHVLASGDTQGEVLLWDLESGTSRAVGTQDGRVYSVAFHPDGTHLASSGSDHEVWIRDLATGQAHALVGHRGEVNQVRYSPDGASLVTVSDDTTVRMWDSETGRPLWRAPVLLGQPAEVLTHTGWTCLEPGGDCGEGAAPQWRASLAREARLASISADGDWVCQGTWDGRLVLWDTRDDGRRVELGGEDARDLLATSGGCLTLEGDGAHLRSSDGGDRVLAEGASAIAVTDDGLLVAVDGEVRQLSAAGTLTATAPADVGPTAVARIGEQLVTGYRDGSLEVTLLDGSGEGDGRRRRLRDTPGIAPTRLVAGPGGTLVAGYTNGFVGVWDMESHALLERRQLHGPVVHIMPTEDHVHAATALGDHGSLDLSVFQEQRCHLLQQVWDSVPVVWQDGQAVRRDPDPDHPCANAGG